MYFKTITVYTLERHDYTQIGYIKKQIINITKDVIVKNENGKLNITLVDNYQNGHNGDWEDEHIYGYETYNLAKKGLIERAKEQIQELKNRIKKIKSTKEPLDV